MTTIPTFSDEVLAMGLDAYERKAAYSGPRFYTVKTRTNAILQFLNNPADSPTDWVNFREIRAFEGLRSGDKLPGGLAVFPAVDREERVSPDTGRPVLVTINDPLLDLVKPGQYDTEGKVKPSPVRAVNAVFLGGVMGEKDPNYEPQPGQHILVKLSRRLGDQLVAKFDERRDENPAFDATLFAWKVSIAGEGAQSVIELSKDRQEVPIDGVEPYDIPAVLTDLRERVEISIAQIADSIAASSPVTAPPMVEDIFASDDTAVEELEQHLATLTTAGLLSEEDPFANVSDARLKRMIADAGGVVPRGANRDILVNLAKSADLAPAGN